MDKNISLEMLRKETNCETMEYIYIYFPPMARQPLGGLDRLICRRFTITHFRHTTLGRTPLDE
jgi:hypothetical protein